MPLIKDTMWLECTSQTLPAGYLGDFTCNRFALLVDENGGSLVRTPVYGLQENQQQRKTNAVLDSEGTLRITAATRYSGLQQDDIHGLINNLSKDKVKEYLDEQLDFATYNVSNFAYSEEKQQCLLLRNLWILLSVIMRRLPVNVFFNPNIMTRANRKLRQMRKESLIWFLQLITGMWTLLKSCYPKVIRLNQYRRI
ncbi:MAG: hypothetical protein IPI68_12850 [Chitinophagaceae bacterium]|nr:hypothetical protein [Chitinophagaceae bacterium]